jgi:phosphoglycerate dehydrogenase-like enzyme
MVIWENFAKNFAVLMWTLCYDILENLVPMQNRFLEELQQKADVLSLHIPWTPETNKMVDALLSMLLRSLLGLNTSRGKNIVTADLVAAMSAEKVLGH